MFVLQETQVCSGGNGVNGSCARLSLVNPFTYLGQVLPINAASKGSGVRLKSVGCVILHKQQAMSQCTAAMAVICVLS